MRQREEYSKVHRGKGVKHNVNISYSSQSFDLNSIKKEFKEHDGDPFNQVDLLTKVLNDLERICKCVFAVKSDINADRLPLPANILHSCVRKE